jgi:hypothetical protein
VQLKGIPNLINNRLWTFLFRLPCKTPALSWFSDRSWKREHRQEKIGLGVEAAIGDTSSPM